MELALRRSFGYAFAPPLNRGIRGLGDCGDGSDPVYDLTCANSVVPVEPISSPIPTTLTLPTSTGSSTTTLSYPGMPGLPSSTTGMCPDGSPPWSDGSCVTCPDGSVPWSDGSCGSTPTTPGATPLTAVASAAATLAAAVAKAVNPTAGTTSCPAGYVYGAPGQSVTISPGVATVGTGKCLPSTATGTPLIAGVSNTTLAIAAFAFVALMMMGKKR